jgi:Cys-tRNA(Pro)/Cys-tRNA(Cys) deacylase
LAKVSVFINGGQRGLQVQIAPKDAMTALGAKPASLI